MSLIRLSPAQRRVKHFTHQAFEGVRPCPPEELEALVESRLINGETEPLILALRSVARYNVARYLAHYPKTERFLNEMVSESLLALTMLVSALNRDILMNSDISRVAASRVRTRIEGMLNELRGITSQPCLRVQRERRAAGEEIQYASVERDLLEDDSSDLDNDEDKCDFVDAVYALRMERELAALILAPENWGLNNTELADKLDVPRQTIVDRRAKLLERFRELTGDSQ